MILLMLSLHHTTSEVHGFADVPIGHGMLSRHSRNAPMLLEQQHTLPASASLITSLPCLTYAESKWAFAGYL